MMCEEVPILEWAKDRVLTASSLCLITHYCLARERRIWTEIPLKALGLDHPCDRSHVHQLQQALPSPKPNLICSSSLLINTYQVSIPYSRAWEYDSEQDRQGLGSHPVYILEGGNNNKKKYQGWRKLKFPPKSVLLESTRC